MQLNFIVVLALHTIVYVIVFLSIFDLYFTTPIVDGVRPVEIPTKPLARRLVLFSADGLRADKFFEVDDLGNSRAPYLRERILHDAMWGISHSKAPTESRPAHVAILGGFFEDVSAIKVLWKRNPVEFDTVLNRSKETWAWGAPDVLPFFNKGSSASHVHIYCHNYHQRPFYQLDKWVFTEVEKFFRKAKYDEDLQKSVHSDKIIFFLHLAGIDSNGHSFDSVSKPYLENIKIVDEGVKKIVELFEDFYGNDKKTAFIFTADHGQTDRGSHGGGEPVETEVPVVAWGAGLRNPDQDENYIGVITPLSYKEIAQTEKWNLDPNQRIDISQIDLAALMSSLISVPFPSNSLGSLPLPYLSGDLPTVVTLSRIHAAQMVEQLIAKYRMVQENSFHFLSSIFGGLNEVTLWQWNVEIVDYIKSGEYQKSLQKSNDLFHYSKKQLLHYQVFHRPFIYFSMLLSISGCLLLGVFFITNKEYTHKSKECLQTINTKDEIGLSLNVVRRIWAGISILFIFILIYYKSSWMQYVYYFTPVIIWSYILSFFHPLMSTFKKNMGNDTRKKTGKIILTNFVWIWVLMMCLFNRGFVSIGLLALSVWPYFSNKRNSTLKSIVWTCLCISMAVFPLLPEVIRKDSKQHKDFVLLSGILGTLLIMCCSSIPRNGRKKIKTTKLELMKNSIGHVCMVLPTLSGILVQFTSSTIFLKEIGKYILWICCLAPVLSSTNVKKRLTGIILFQLVAYVVFSLTYDALFCVNLAALMLVWLEMETGISKANNEVACIYEDPKFVWNNKRRLKPFNLNAMRNTSIFIFFLIVGFFGIFSMEAINGLNIRKLPFLPVSNPVMLIITLIYKLSVHYVFIACTFFGIITLSNIRIHDALCMLMLQTDVMLMHFLFWVKDSGSWAEIGISVARLGIIVSLPLAASVLMLFSKIYVSLELPNFLQLRKLLH